jgi:hypothetical protein
MPHPVLAHSARDLPAARAQNPRLCIVSAAGRRRAVLGNQAARRAFSLILFVTQRDLSSAVACDPSTQVTTGDGARDAGSLNRM